VSILKMISTLSLVLLIVVLTSVSSANGAITLNGLNVFPKDRFYFCADAESFAVVPTDFSKLVDMASKDGRQFGKVLKQIGKPTLRLASMQRWDWRGEAETLALVSSSFSARRKNRIGYHYFTAKQYFDFAKVNGISTIPMLDARFFYDQEDGSVKSTPENIEKAARQYAGGYAKFINDGGYDVAFWEIGNEDYSYKYKFSAELYAKVVKGYIDEVKKVIPGARFGIQLNIWSPEFKSWALRLLKSLKGYEKHINYAVVHYYSPVDYTDKINDDMMNFLRENGFNRTKLAVTEWRHSWKPDEYDRTFKSAPVFARYLMFLFRRHDVEAACVHALPIFGGLAEWSNGSQWTAYSEGLGKIGIPDKVGIPRWRILPFGLAQKMIVDAVMNCKFADYKENFGKVSIYLFKKTTGGYSLVITNESDSSVSDDIKIVSKITLHSVTGNELFCADPQAFPLDEEPQPWSVKPINIGENSDISSGSSVVLKGSVLKVNLRPYAVITLDLK
jgi:hypothetical protein